MRFRIPSWRMLFIGTADVIAIVIVPLLLAGFNYYNKAAIPAQPMEAPVYSGALPAPADT